MEGGERDTTQDWLIGEGAAPPLLGELVERIDDALRIARSSEEAVRTVGESAAEAAIEAASRARDAVEQAMRAAEHARRSAELAERASSTMLETRRRTVLPRTQPEDESLRSFSDRADRVVARLRALQRIPLRSPDRPRTP